MITTSRAKANNPSNKNSMIIDQQWGGLLFAKMTKVRESSEKGVIRMLGETRIRELKKLKKKTSKVQIIHTKYPGPRVRYANQNKLKELGWVQKISLSKGISLI